MLHAGRKSRPEADYSEFGCENFKEYGVAGPDTGIINDFSISLTNER